MLLDHVSVRLKRIDFCPERQPRDSVHRIAHQIGLQLNEHIRSRRFLPAPDQPPRHRLQRRKVTLHMGRIKACHHHTSLAQPRLTVGTKNALRQIHFTRDFLEARRTSQAVRPVTQDQSHHLMIANHQYFSLADLQLEERPKFNAPRLKLLMKPRRFDLQRITQNRNATRAGQRAKLTQHRWRGQRLGSRCVKGFGVHGCLVFDQRVGRALRLNGSPSDARSRPHRHCPPTGTVCP